MTSGDSLRIPRCGIDSLNPVHRDQSHWQLATSRSTAGYGAPQTETGWYFEIRSIRPLDIIVRALYPHREVSANGPIITSASENGLGLVGRCSLDTFRPIRIR